MVKNRDWLLKAGAWATVGFLLTFQTAFGADGVGETAYCTILNKLYTFGPPVVKVIALLVALGAIIGGFVEFARRQLGWFIGILIVGILIAMALYALSGVAGSTLADVMSSAGCSS